uniref:Class I SAM-dependent methyltransferase n=2 Tax=Chenopodium quinoa TaxID=63459 RepID=A0A803M361_CHEQI
MPSCHVIYCPRQERPQPVRPGLFQPVPPETIRSIILNRVYNGTSPYENFPPPHVAELLRPKRVKGWGSYGAVFENLIRKAQPKTIIEVGTFLGASATHMAQLTRQLGLQTQILCLDDFRGWPGFRDRVDYVPVQNGDVLLFAQFLQNVIYLNSSESTLPIPFTTGSTLEKLCEWGVMADLIEVDAGHDFHSAWSDINRAYKLLRPGGVMFGHDYFTKYDDRGVRRAVDLFAKVNGFKVNVDGQHWVIE